MKFYAHAMDDPTVTDGDFWHKIDTRRKQVSIKYL
jgi:hypothetical protein